MSYQTLRARLESLAARTPDSDDIDRVLDHAIAILKQQFTAYTIDIMWESGQGRHTHLVAIKIDESFEQHGYDSRALYHPESHSPSSLTGWCYENDRSVWLIDKDGLRSDKAYRNLLRNDIVPANTIYAYNKARPICTEVCWPLRIEVKKGVYKAAGVLNIESTQIVNPTEEAQGLVRAAARVIAQLITRRITAESARKRTAEAIEEMGRLAANLNGESTLHPMAFLALPMGIPGARDIVTWVRETLLARGNGIHLVSADETTGRIVGSLYSAVRRSNFAIVISTDYNPSVMWEWGFIAGNGRPIVRLHQEQGGVEKPPFDIADVRAWSYAAPGEAVDKAKFVRVLNDSLDALEKQDSGLASLWEKRSSVTDASSAGGE